MVSFANEETVLPVKLCFHIGKFRSEFEMNNFNLLKIDVDVERYALLRSIFDEHANQCCWIIHNKNYI